MYFIWHYYRKIILISILKSKSKLTETYFLKVFLLGLCLTRLLEDSEWAAEGCVDLEHCSFIVELAAVVWSWKYRQKLAIGAIELISIFYNLMSSTDHVQIIFGEKILNDRLSKCYTYSTIILFVCLLMNVSTGVRPKDVCQ